MTHDQGTGLQAGSELAVLNVDKLGDLLTQDIPLIIRVSLMVIWVIVPAHASSWLRTWSQPERISLAWPMPVAFYA